MSKVIVVGGGPAGMMAAYAAASCGHKVILLEKNEKLGKKLYITGKGRCNVTNSSDMDVLFSNVMSNRKFLYSAFYTFSNEMVMDFFKAHGLALKVERGNRVFPVSDHSSDVIAACQRALRAKNVSVKLHTEVAEILTESEETGNTEKAETEPKVVTGVRLADGTAILADHVILATGGISYPSTGSTGDGYRFAEAAGHCVVPPVPALVPFEVKEHWVRDLQGLSLKNTAITLLDGKKKLYEDFGEMLFTHFGVSGPMILSASAAVKSSFFEKELCLEIDLKPALDLEQLDKRILREFEEAKNKSFKNAVVHLFPSKLIPVMIELSGIDPEKKVHEISREERQKFAGLMKKLPITVTGKRGFQEAIITKGGVNVREVDPSTMMSRKVRNLYFCGELLDLDAMTGGYNLQIAWSTGYLAGINCSLQ